MNATRLSNQPSKPATASRATRRRFAERKVPAPLTNYTLSTVCPACESKTFKLACKVRCGKCGFMWDCSEL